MGSDGLPFVVQTTMHFRFKLAALLGLEFEQSEAYAQLVRAKLAERPRAEWLRALAIEGVPCSIIQSMDDALANPEVASASVGERRVPASPYVFEGRRRDTDVPPPELGAHTDEILTGLLGYEASRVDALRASGATI